MSTRRVRKIAAIGQWWESELSGVAWRIRQIHRADLQAVELVRPGDGSRRMSFGELAHGYVLLDDDEVLAEA